MSFKYVHFEGFKNYCFGIVRNKGIEFTNEEIENFDELKKFFTLLFKLQEIKCLEIYTPDVYSTIIEGFKKDPKQQIYEIGRLKVNMKKFFLKEKDFYAVMAHLAITLNIQVQYCEEYIFQKHKNIFYPGRIKVITYGSIIERIHTFSLKDATFHNYKGVYFIYDSSGILSYIGKSTSCVLKRSLESVKERKLFNFAKIEYRVPKTVSEVAIYEAYYIGKYKPRCNSDMVFDDEITFDLPKLDINYVVERNENDFIEMEQKYYTPQTMEIEDFFRMNNVLLYNEKNIKLIENKGYYNKCEAKRIALNKCLQQAKEKGREIVEEIFI